MKPLLVLLVSLCACAPPADPHRVPGDDGVYPVAGLDPERPRLRYVDGQVSANDSCMIRLGKKLNPRVPPLYVNGGPVGFC